MARRSNADTPQQAGCRGWPGCSRPRSRAWSPRSLRPREQSLALPFASHMPAGLGCAGSTGRGRSSWEEGSLQPSSSLTQSPLRPRSLQTCFSTAFPLQPPHVHPAGPTGASRATSSTARSGPGEVPQPLPDPKVSSAAAKPCPTSHAQPQNTGQCKHHKPMSITVLQ